MVSFERFGMIPNSHSIVTKSCHFREKARYWSKMANFSHYLTFDASVRGEGSQSIAVTFGKYKKTRMMWRPDGEKYLRIHLAVSTECRHVTERQTSCEDIVRAMHTVRRAVKT